MIQEEKLLPRSHPFGNTSSPPVRKSVNLAHFKRRGGRVHYVRNVKGAGKGPEGRLKSRDDVSGFCSFSQEKCPKGCARRSGEISQVVKVSYFTQLGTVIRTAAQVQKQLPAFSVPLRSAAGSGTK